jgi:hypothetical protein
MRDLYIRVADPHHAIRANNITVATVPCRWGECPPGHFYQRIENEMTDTRNTGLTHKYDVRRRDGKDAPGQRHHLDWLFVLDIAHDWHAREALAAYAKSCRTEYPQLSEDLRQMLTKIPFVHPQTIWSESPPGVLP